MCVKIYKVKRGYRMTKSLQYFKDTKRSGKKEGNDDGR